MKGHYKESKNTSHKLEKHCATHTVDKVLYPEYIKDFYKATRKKTTPQKADEVACQKCVCVQQQPYITGNVHSDSVCAAQKQKNILNIHQ